MTQPERHRLNGFFNPKSIALVGASPNSKIIRGRIATAVMKGGYAGKVFPISRSHDEVFGTRCYASVADVPVVPDLAVITVPAEHVPACLEQCALKGTRAALILSSGFGEQGDDEGRGREAAVREIAQRHNMVVCGPNAEGFFNAGLPLHATFSPTVLDDAPSPSADPTSGRVAIVSQSGGVGFAIYDRGRVKGLDVSFVASMGNEVALHSLDVVDYFVSDPGTDVVAMFIEGLKSPSSFAATAEKARAAGKPIIAAKMGRSNEAARASASHTASMAGNYTTYEAVLRRHGVALVDDIEQLVDTSIAFSRFRNRVAHGKRVAVLSASGGAGIWLTDTCVSNGLTVGPLDEHTRERLTAMMPAYGNAENPVDITAQGVYSFGYSGPLEVVVESPLVDMVLVTCSMVKVEIFERDLENLRRIAESTDKPILFCGYTTIHADVVRTLGEAGFACTNSMPNACKALFAFAEYCEFLKSPAVPADVPPIDDGAVTALLDSLPEVVCEHRAREVLLASGFDVPPAWLVNSAADAVGAFERARSPVALKLQSAQLTHKTDAGGVVLNLGDTKTVEAGYNDLLEAADRVIARSDLDGVLVQPMAGAGVEIVIGVSFDRDFGPMLMVGFGGVFVEVLRDVAFSPASLTLAQAEALILSLKMSSILHGVRGAPPSDVDALAKLLVRVGRFAVQHQTSISEIDLNPVIVHARGDGVTIVDALMVKHAPEAPRAVVRSKECP